MKNTADIWKFQAGLSLRLVIWAAASSAAGLVLIFLATGFWRGFGIQALAWGAADGLIAGLGRWLSGRRRRSTADPNDPKLLEAESRKLRRTLWINTGLDLLYIAGGIILASTVGRGSPVWRGHGWGIVVQGVFLWFFDLIHAQSVPPGALSAPPRAFSDPAHQPFLLAGGKAAALLVHGFPGTPAEMRPLAETLHEQGWTVQGILLPGFGSQLPDILDRGHGDWLEAVQRALATLKKQYAPVLLVGYSLGGALSLQAAASGRLEGLVLLSPFWRLGTALQRLIGPLLRPFLPRYFRPLHRADLDDPKLQRSLHEFFPDIDLQEPESRAWLRDLQIPVSVIDQIMKSGRRGYRSARSVSAPTLVVQGTEDELVPAQHTRMLAERMTASRYLEIPGGHNIVDGEGPGWRSLEQALIEFGRSIRQDERIRA